MAENKLITGVKITLYKWSYFTLLITGFWAHFVAYVILFHAGLMAQKPSSRRNFSHLQICRDLYPSAGTWAPEPRTGPLQVLFFYGGDRGPVKLRIIQKFVTVWNTAVLLRCSMLKDYVYWRYQWNWQVAKLPKKLSSSDLNFKMCGSAFLDNLPDLLFF